MLLKVSAKPLQICSKQKVQIEQVNQLSDSAVLEKKKTFFFFSWVQEEQSNAGSTIRSVCIQVLSESLKQ